MFFLDVTGPEGGRTVAFPVAELSIGSASDCDLLLTAPGVAPHHASLIERDGKVFLLDLATATIAINGKRVVEMAALVEDCVVTIGPYQMRFREVDLPPDTVQTMTLRLPSSPPIPMSLRDIEIESVPSTSDVRSSELIESDQSVEAREQAETDPSIPVAAPLPPLEEEEVGVKTPHHPSAGRNWRGPPSSLHASQDPIEIELLRAIDEGADVAAALVVYGDWLEERGDTVRADYVRTLEKLAAPGGGHDPETRRRLTVLGDRITNAWRAKLMPRSTPIERCGAPNGQPAAGPCPKTWGALDRMSVDDVRRCTVCSTFVHYAPDVKTAVAWRHRPVVVDIGANRLPGDLDAPAPAPSIRFISGRPPPTPSARGSSGSR